MFTTPLRSEIMPPTAAYASGVAHASVEPMSAPHETTVVRWSFDEFVARTPRPMPMSPIAIAPQPIRRTPRVTAQMPHATASRPTRSGTQLRVRVQRRQREEERERAEHHPGARDLARRPRDAVDGGGSGGAHVATSCCGVGGACFRPSPIFLRACQT